MGLKSPPPAAGPVPAGGGGGATPPWQSATPTPEEAISMALALALLLSKVQAFVTAAAGLGPAWGTGLAAGGVVLSGAVAQTEAKALQAALRTVGRSHLDAVFPNGVWGHVGGTDFHTTIAPVINGLNNPLIRAEVTFGRVRLDIVIYDSAGNPIAVFDWKTGDKGLEPGRINEIRNNLPPAFRNIPIEEL